MRPARRPSAHRSQIAHSRGRRRQLIAVAVLSAMCMVPAASDAIATEIIVGGSPRASSGGRVETIVGRPAAGADTRGRSGTRSHVSASAPAPSTNASVRSPSPAVARSGPEAAGQGTAERESDRLWILERELEKESSAIEEKQRLLSQPSAAASDPVVVALRSRLGNELVDHERNVVALRRELERAKSVRH
ncbi:hypothetical protein ACFPPF_17555 [Xenophilus aerolatus]|nr:hypothetical protein [Xenophilus aerolatus]